MTQYTECDGCGDRAKQYEDDFYNVSRFTEEENAHGDFCPDCMSDELIEALDVQEVPDHNRMALDTDVDSETEE